MLKRLTVASGEVTAPDQESKEGDDVLVRPAILVHSGPNGKKLTFQSSDGEISFDEERIKRVVKNQNKLIRDMEKQYGGKEKTPVGAYPALLDQHKDDSNDRIRGRLNMPLWFEIRDVPKVGKNVACAMTHISFLGKDNIARVKDGRIYHLSIGIHEESDTLGETSTVIEPAAAGAMLLSKSKDLEEKGEKTMSTQLVAGKDAKTLRLAKLAELSEGIKGFNTKLIATKDTLSLAKKTGKISHRLNSLMSAKKLTPAEFKTLDLKKLAKLEDEALDIVLSSFEARQDVIERGQRGSTSAVEFAEMGKDLEKKQFKRLKGETQKDLMKMSGKKLSFKEGIEQEVDEHKDDKELGSHKMGAEGSHVVPGEGGDEKQGPLHMCHMEMGKCLASGDLEGAKKYHAEMSKHLGHGMTHMSMGAEGDQSHLEALQMQLDENTTQMARLAGMVSELMSVEKDEGHDLAAEGAEGKEDEAPQKPGDEKPAPEHKPAPEAKDDKAALKAETEKDAKKA